MSHKTYVENLLIVLQLLKSKMTKFMNMVLKLRVL